METAAAQAFVLSVLLVLSFFANVVSHGLYALFCIMLNFNQTNRTNRTNRCGTGVSYCPIKRFLTGHNRT
jgi:hypothetical protein